VVRRAPILNGGHNKCSDVKKMKETTHYLADKIVENAEEKEKQRNEIYNENPEESMEKIHQDYEEKKAVVVGLGMLAGDKIKETYEKVQDVFPILKSDTTNDNSREENENMPKNRERETENLPQEEPEHKQKRQIEERNENRNYEDNEKQNIQREKEIDNDKKLSSENKENNQQRHFESEEVRRPQTDKESDWKFVGREEEKLYGVLQDETMGFWMGTSGSNDKNSQISSKDKAREQRSENIQESQINPPKNPINVEDLELKQRKLSRDTELEKQPERDEKRLSKNIDPSINLGIENQDLAHLDTRSQKRRIALRRRA